MVSLRTWERANISLTKFLLNKCKTHNHLSRLASRFQLVTEWMYIRLVYLHIFGIYLAYSWHICDSICHTHDLCVPQKSISFPFLIWIIKFPFLCVLLKYVQLLSIFEFVSRSGNPHFVEPKYGPYYGWKLSQENEELKEELQKLAAKVFIVR